VVEHPQQVLSTCPGPEPGQDAFVLELQIDALWRLKEVLGIAAFAEHTSVVVPAKVATLTNL
jgi:hypothetical protein